MSYTADALPVAFRKKLFSLLRLTRCEQGIYDALLAGKTHEKLRPRFRHLKHIADRREALLLTVYTPSFGQRWVLRAAYRKGRRRGYWFGRSKEAALQQRLKSLLQHMSAEFQSVAESMAGKQPLHAYHALLSKCMQDIALTQ